MAAAGFNATRMGEFAWHIFEPREGQFDFTLFDKAIEVLGRARRQDDHVHADGDAAALADGQLSGGAEGRRHWAPRKPRLAPACRHLQPGLSRPLEAHHGGDGRALQAQSLCDRLANRQRTQHDRVTLLFGRYASRIPEVSRSAVRLHRGAQPRMGRRFLGDGLRRFQPGRSALRSGAWISPARDTFSTTIASSPSPRRAFRPIKSRYCAPPIRTGSSSTIWGGSTTSTCAGNSPAISIFLGSTSTRFSMTRCKGWADTLSRRPTISMSRAGSPAISSSPSSSPAWARSPAFRP